MDTDAPTIPDGERPVREGLLEPVWIGSTAVGNEASPRP